MAFYLLQKQIQDYADNYLEKKHQLITFYEAISHLHLLKASNTEVVRHNFMNVDFSDYAVLKEIIDNHPIDVTSLVTDPSLYTKLHSEDLFPFHKNSISVTFPLRNMKKVIHANDFFVTIYVLDGSCKVYTDEGDLLLCKGEFIIVPPQKPFDIDPMPESVIFNITIRKSTFDSTFFHLLSDDNALSHFFQTCLHRASDNMLSFTLEPTAYVCNILKNIYVESRFIRNYSSAICMNYTEILFSELLRHYSGKINTKSSRSSVYNNMPTILTYIKGNYKHLTLTSLGRFFNYESNYLGKHIKLCTGLSFNEIITQHKMKSALLLLQTTPYSMDTISEYVGYNNADHFSRTFKKIYHCTPSSYRNDAT